MKLFVMSDGTTRQNNPTDYTERNAMKHKAKELEKILKPYVWRKKGEEFQTIWLQNPAVIEYRQLLRDIWAWKDTAQVFREVIACDECHAYDVPMFKVTRNYQDHIPTIKTLCATCRDDNLRIFDWPDWSFDVQPI